MRRYFTKSNITKKTIFVFLIGLFLLQLCEAQTPLRKKHYNLEKGLAIEGYDPVAYFTENKALQGKGNYVATLEGVTYNFVSLSNKELFIKASKKFEPQFGGWCAYAMGEANEKVAVDPETFKIINGKLYLFFHNWANNTLLKWNKNEANLKAQADKNWEAIFH
jgi:YHS domain-containing protein